MPSHDRRKRNEPDGTDGGRRFDLERPLSRVGAIVEAIVMHDLARHETTFRQADRLRTEDLP
jgi:hypothetical protein